MQCNEQVCPSLKQLTHKRNCNKMASRQFSRWVDRSSSTTFSFVYHISYYKIVNHNVNHPESSCLNVVLKADRYCAQMSSLNVYVIKDSQHICYLSRSPPSATLGNVQSCSKLSSCTSTGTIMIGMMLSQPLISGMRAKRQHATDSPPAASG